MDDGRHDFDFLFGRWHVDNRRLVGRLVGSTQWESFDTTLETRPVLGGMGNVDAFADGRGWEAMTLRLFDPDERHWSIWWAATTRPGHLDPPVVGRFEDGHGRFLGDDVHDGQPVRVLYEWKDIAAESATWQQSFSPDGGQTWETNWVMSLSRVGR
jgi:hypothetical protein